MSVSDAVSHWEVPQTQFIAGAVGHSSSRDSGFRRGSGGDEGVGAHHTGDELN